MNISLDENEFFELFREAFEEGKCSFSDLRDGAAELLLIRLKVNKGIIIMPVEQKPVKKKLDEISCKNKEKDQCCTYSIQYNNDTIIKEKLNYEDYKL